jgi:hypothetical protein
VSTKPTAGRQLRVSLAGDRRTAENLILELRALAQDCGIAVADAKVVSPLKIGRTSVKKLKKTRKSKV